jgi:hypothetical protein
MRINIKIQYYENIPFSSRQLLNNNARQVTEIRLHLNSNFNELFGISAFTALNKKL